VVVGRLGVAGRGERVGAGVVGVDAQRADQLLVAGEVAVQGRGGRAHLPGVTVIGAILTARQAMSLGHGATPTRAFLDGYSTGLLAAPALMLLGAALTLLALDHRLSFPAAAHASTARTAHASRPEPVG
jgi:hypothetical protein